jgi:hypothetical protein
VAIANGEEHYSPFAIRHSPLAWYFELEKELDTAKLVWVLAFPLTFAACMLILAVSDRLGRRPDNGAG